MKNDDDPPLGVTGRDRTVAIARALAGAVPGFGATIAELITVVVPGQRQDRFEHWLHRLTERLAATEGVVLRLYQPENVDLIETGAYQAARAISEERREQLAKIVADGIADPDREYIETKRVLRLLERLDDGEVFMLKAYSVVSKHGQSPELHKKAIEYEQQHARNWIPTPVTSDMSLEEAGRIADANAVIEAGRQQLLALGLVELPPSGWHLRLTDLGELVLKRLGLDEEIR